MLIHQNNCKIVASTGFENHFLFFVFGINLICKTHFPLSLFTSVNHFHFHELEKTIFPAWAMGASTGHTAVALWRDGSLQVGVSSLKFNQSVSTDLRVKCLLAILANQWNSMQPILGLAWGGETMDNANQSTLLTQFGRLAGYNTVWAPLRLRLKISFFQNLISALRGVIRWMLSQLWEEWSDECYRCLGFHWLHDGSWLWIRGLLNSLCLLFAWFFA